MKYHSKVFTLSLSIISLLVLNCSEETIVDPQSNTIPLKTNITYESVNEILSSRIPGLIDTLGIPGLQIAVIKGNSVLWNESFGVKNNETQEVVNNQSIFQAASLSKTVLAYAVMKLVEEEELELDEPLINYAPESYIINEFNNGNQLDERFNIITARMVLNHTPGFPNWRNGDSINFIFEPGQRFSYSGEGFVYLQRIVEYISNKTLNEFITETVLEPLGMTKSSYVWKDEMEGHITNGHKSLGQVNPVAKPLSANGAGSLLTTAEDYAKFMLAIVNNVGIQKETVDSMLAIQTNVPKKWENYSAFSDQIFWGLGIGLQQTELGKAFWHWGDNDDFKCFTIAYPKEKIGLVYFTNSYNGLSVANELIKTALGGYYPATEWMDY